MLTMIDTCRQGFKFLPGAGTVLMITLLQNSPLPARFSPRTLILYRLSGSKSLRQYLGKGREETGNYWWPSGDWAAVMKNTACINNVRKKLLLLSREILKTIRQFVLTFHFITMTCSH